MMSPDNKQLHLAAMASSLAYGSPEDAAIAMHALGFDRLIPFADEATDTQGFVAASQEQIIVAFRGTSSLRDFVTDAQVDMEEYGGGRVHRGFLAAMISVANDASDIVEKLRDNSQQVLLTGHSLGGALATLFAWRLWKTIVGSLITFGQPRVGDARFIADFQKHFGDVTWRVVNEADLVPRLPGVLMGYRHAGHQLFIDGLGHLENDPSWWQRLPSDLFSLWSQWQRGKLALLVDHGMEHYLAQFPA